VGLCLHLEQCFGLGGMGVWSAVAKSSAFLDEKVCVLWKKETKWVWRDVVPVYEVKGYMESGKRTKHRDSGKLSITQSSSSSLVKRDF